MKIRLNNEEIIGLASLVASDLGIKRLDESALLMNLEKNPVMPSIISDGCGQLWVDRYYVAYSLSEDTFVHYVYITPEHASEELKVLPKDILKCAKPKEVEMLKDIARQLKNALKSGRPFYLTLEYRRRLEKTSIIEI